MATTNTKNTQKTQKKQKQMQQVVVKEERKKASASTLAYAEYLVAPYDAPNVAPAPSPVPVRETCVRHNLTLDLSAYNQNSGQFSIEVKPHLSDTLSITSTSADTQDQQPIAFDLISGGVVGTDKALGGQATHLSTGNQATTKLIADSGGTQMTAIAINGTAQTSVYVGYVTMKGGAAAKLTLKFWTLASGGTWTVATTTVVNQTLGSSITNFTLNLPASCIGIGCTIAQSSYAYGISVKASFSLTYSSGTGNLALATLTSMHQTFGLNLLQNINQLQHWRVVAQDLLITYEGDTLNDGGSLASARVPSNWVGGTSDTFGNPYSDIVALPYDRYDGPLKDGTHVHWIPGDIDDLSPISTIEEDQQFGYFKMVAGGTMTHPNSSVRVRVCTTIGYFSTNPDYGEMSWAPPPTDLGLLLQYVARVIPAATSNDKHLISKLAAFARKNVNDGLKYLIENPAQIAHLAKMALALLA